MLDMLLPGHSVDEMAIADIGVAMKFEETLRAIDDRLRCFWVKPDATSFDNPGRWHIGFLHGNPELNQYWVIQNDDGSYCEPQDRHLARLQAADTSRFDVYARITQNRAEAAKARQKAFEEKRREFREKALERLDFIHGPRPISVPKTVTAGGVVLP